MGNTVLENGISTKVLGIISSECYALFNMTPKSRIRTVQQIGTLGNGIWQIEIAFEAGFPVIDRLYLIQLARKLLRFKQPKQARELLG